MQSSANVIQMYVSMFISRAVLNTFFLLLGLIGSLISSKNPGSPI